MDDSNKYINGIHRSGKIWGILLAVAIFMYPVAVSIIYNAAPDWDGLLMGLLGVIPIYWTVGTIEMFTYIPMLGSGGTYLSFVTGNISNLKLPCALDCMKQLDTSVDTEEGELVSTISIAVSSITTTLIIFIGMLLIVPLKGVLESETLSVCFEQILPALFGALAVVFLSKNIKIAIPPVLLMLVLFIFVPGLGSLVSLMVPVGAIFTIICSRIMYKKGKI